VQGFFESVLAMENIPDIILETGDAPRFAKLCENLPGAQGSLEGLVVFSQQNQRLDGTAQRAPGFFPDFQGLVEFNRLLVMLNRRAVIAAGIERVGPRPQPPAPGLPCGATCERLTALPPTVPKPAWCPRGFSRQPDRPAV